MLASNGRATATENKIVDFPSKIKSQDPELGRQGSLGNKTALISGGARGIGAAIALELAAQGANIIILDLIPPDSDLLEKSTLDWQDVPAINNKTESGLKLKSQDLKLGQKSSPAAIAYQGDVADFKQMKEIVGQITNIFPAIDILVNNAGLTRDNLLLRMSESDFDLVTDVCLKGAFNLTKQILPLMLKKRWGRIINIASVVGLTGNAGQVNYAAAKAGLIGLTKSLAKEVAGRNITCNAIAPGFIETEMTASLSGAAQAKLLAQIPAQRPGRPNEVAKLAAFLAGEDAAYITGEVIRIDGGFC